MIKIVYEEFKEALEAVLLKGKYSSSTTSKIGVVNDCVVAIIENPPRTLVHQEKGTDNTYYCNLTFANASDTLIAQVTVLCETMYSPEDMPKMFFFDIEKCLKYLSAFNKKKTLVLNFHEGKLELIQDSKTASMPLAVEHRNVAFISKLKSITIPTEGYPTFGQSVLTTKLLVKGEELAKGIKNSSVVGTATYKLDYENLEEGNFLWLSSSNFHKTDSMKDRIPILVSEGESVTIEFSAPLDKFCKGPTQLFLATDKPMLMVCADRKLVIAPRLRGN